jgi:hypothetical protein
MCARLEKLMQASIETLAEIMPPRSTPEPDEYTVAFRWMRWLHEDAAWKAIGYTAMVESNSYPKDSHRELIFMHVLGAWEDLGGTLPLSHDPYEKTSAAILYFQRVVGLILGEPPLADATVVEIIRREVRRRAGKPPRDRRRNRRK